MGHHILPQYYLRGFADPSKPDHIWMYQKGASHEPRLLPIKAVSQSPNHFDPEIDKWLNTAVEIPAQPILDRLRKSCPPTVLISSHEKNIIAVYFQVMLLRTRRFRRWAETVIARSTQEVITQLDRALMAEVTPEGERVPDLSLIQGLDQKRIEMHQRVAKKVRSEAYRPYRSPRVAKVISGKWWRIYKAEGAASFCTCEDMVIYDRSRGLLGSDIFIPLSSNALLYATSRRCVDGTVEVASDEAVYRACGDIIDWSDQFVYYSAKDAIISARPQLSGVRFPLG